MQIYPDTEALARAAAEQFVTLAREAIARRGRFSVALAGGSTPRPTYERLSGEPFASQVDWTRVHIFWGDERCVPPDHPESNYRMARETLLDRLTIPAANVHRIPCEQAPEQAAAAYEATLRAFFAEGKTPSEEDPIPRFDLILLGLGEDGHTASLFPGTAVLHEEERWVVATYVEKLGAWRVTLTPVVLNAAAHVTFLVAGKHKAQRLREVLMGPYQPDRLPAQIVRPHRGHLTWLLDMEAARLVQV